MTWSTSGRNWDLSWRRNPDRASGTLRRSVLSRRERNLQVKQRDGLASAEPKRCDSVHCDLPLEVRRTGMEVGVNYPWFDYGWDFGLAPPGWRGGQADPRWYAEIDATEVWTWRGLVTYYTVFVIDL